jgi:hypothetical protein
MIFGSLRGENKADQAREDGYMAEPTDDPKEQPPDSAAADALSQTVIGGTETFFAAQAHLLAEVRSVSLTWLRRRQEAIAEAQQSLDEMRACRTLADLMRVQQDWINRTMHRFAADMVAWGDTANDLSRKTLQQIDAGARGMGGAEKAPGLISEVQAKPTRSEKS